MGRNEVLLLIFAVVLLAAAVEYVVVAYAQRLRRGVQWRILLPVLLLYGLLLYLRPSNLLLSNGIVLAVTTLGGTLIGAGLTTRSTVISFSIASSLADILSFTVGPTRILLDQFGGATSSLVTYLTITIPVREQVLPLIGIGDLMILSAYFAALRQLGCSALVSFGAPLSGVIAALSVGLVLGGVFGIPFMAVAVVGVLLLSRKPTSVGNPPGAG